MNDMALDRITPETGPQRSQARLCVPIIVFAVLAAVLGWSLTADPKSVPSTLIGKPVPEFSLPPV